MNIYRREIRANFKSTLFWSLGILFLIAAGMGKFMAYAQSGEDVNQMLVLLPPALQAFLGISTDAFNYSKASGFFAILFFYLLLMAAIHASMLGAVIISKEERDRTTEFLFVKPRTRAQIVTAKLLAALTCVVVFNLVSWALSAGVVGAVSQSLANTLPGYVPEDLGGGIARLMAGMFLVQALFLSVGMAAAAALKRPKASTGVAMAVMLATFLLSIFIDFNRTGAPDANGVMAITENMAWLKPFTPFKYLDPASLLQGGEYAWGYLLLAAIVAIVLFVATYRLFRRRDLKA